MNDRRERTNGGESQDFAGFVRNSGIWLDRRYFTCRSISRISSAVTHGAISRRELLEAERESEREREFESRQPARGARSKGVVPS